MVQAFNGAGNKPMIHASAIENIKINKLRCSFSNTNNEPLFFSLVDYRNNLFTSNDPKKIMEFYDGFDNRDQLIQWMKERPKGVSYIHEVEGDKDIIVVIPTADFNGKYARECRDNIFKGLHMVFMESGGKGDFYFNLAHNCNVGIKKAMDYNPKWVVFSGDDMYKIDDVEKLQERLNKLNNLSVDAVFTIPGRYHSTPSILGIPKNIFFQTMKNFSGFSKYANITYTTLKNLRRFNDVIYIPRINFKINMINKFSNSIFLRTVKHFVNTLSFGIFSSEFIKFCEGKLYDEVYINEMEDTDLSIRLSNSSKKSVTIDFKGSL
jgi:hypothetical protein